MDSIVKAGLDYGYWIGVCGAVMLIASVGLLNKQWQKYVAYAGVVAILSAGLALGFSRPGKEVRPTAISGSSEGPAGVTPKASTDAPAPEPDFDSSPFVHLSFSLCEASCQGL